MHRRLLGEDAKKVGGETSYAGTANRDLCKDLEIKTSFVKKGKPFKEEKEKDFVRRELARVGDSDGGLVRNAEGALRHASDQSQKEGDGDGDPVHFLRHPHRERVAAGGAVARAAFG